MLEPVPWFVSGADHSAAVARMLAFSATNGANGITLPGDFEVRAKNIPGTAVQIYPGGASLFNAYPGVEHQSYIVRNITATDFEIPPTGSSPAEGVTRYVIVRISDPDFGGAVPADGATGPYVFFELVSDIANLPYPHAVLASIEQPASTGTIEQSMITDLRKMANPREELVGFSEPNVTGDIGLTLNSHTNVGEYFPNAGGNQNIDVPSWATAARITAHWVGLEYSGNVNPHGQMWVEYGPYAGPSERERTTQRFGYNHFSIPGKARANWIVSDTVYVPYAYRGTKQKFVMKARYNGNSDEGVAMDPYSGVILEVRFLERVDASTS